MNIAIALLALGVLILLHELGHFMAARAFGVDVVRFSIGFGPALARRRIRSTEYRLALVPFGGYVKLRADADAGGDPARCYAAQPPWVRFVIAAAGPVMNLVLAVLIFAGVLVALGRPGSPPVVGAIAPDGPALIAGLQPGDVVLKVNSRAVASWRDVDRQVRRSRGNPVTLRIQRDGAERKLIVMPRRMDVREPLPERRWSIGAGPHLMPRVGTVRPASAADDAGIRAGDRVVAVADTAIFTPGDIVDALRRDAAINVMVARDGGEPVALRTATARQKGLTRPDVELADVGIDVVAGAMIEQRYRPLEALRVATAMTAEFSVLIVRALWALVTGQLDASAGLTGPLGLVGQMDQSTREGLRAFALVAAALSVNLAVFNLLPVPALDGGYCLFALIETCARRRLPRRAEKWTLKAGAAMLIAVMGYAVYHDIVRLLLAR